MEIDLKTVNENTRYCICISRALRLGFGYKKDNKFIFNTLCDGDILILNHLKDECGFTGSTEEFNNILKKEYYNNWIGEGFNLE